MRKVFKLLLIVSLLTTALVACGTSPVNLQVTKIIGAEGGTLSSTDGAITLEIPAGTFSSPTTVGVEPTTSSDAPWGEASGWRLTGLGIQMKAVGVKFKYSGELPIEWSSVAMQDESKAWLGFRNTVVSKSEKTISVTLPAQAPLKNVTTSGFRVQGGDSTEKKIFAYYFFYFSPTESKIKVKATLDMIFEFCKYSSTDSINNNLTFPINISAKKCNPLSASAQDLYSIKSFVNGIKQGNSTIGNIYNVFDGGVNKYSYQYIAPAKVPSPDRVKVSITIYPGPTKEETFNAFVTIEPACFPTKKRIQSTVSKNDLTCVDLWDGTITTTIKGNQAPGFSIDSAVTSNVVFEVDKTSTPESGVVNYRLQSGNYDYKATSILRDCTTTATSSGSLPTGVDFNLPNYTNSFLALDTNLDPQTYIGGGFSLVNVTETRKCLSSPADETNVASRILSWWTLMPDFQKASVDGDTLKGFSESPDNQTGFIVRSDWLFTRRSQ